MINLENAYNILMILLLICSFVILFSNDFLLIIPMTAVFSLIITVIYLIFRAPDVAITEVAVGACVSTILLFTAYKKTNPDQENSSINFIHIIPLAIILLGALYLILELPEFGSMANPIHHHVSNYYLANTKIDTGINSVVSAILASYRGYDTMGETIVIMLSAIGVLNILKKS
ncbi:putative monovalent cation/H+ antiporter subunit B [Candidatus Arcanobacter lacustris]|jgi:multicomponent Na+:H+ antiporter subunit B|uniref:Putative monovalent cation/H+ antiporter subunit B n=1 Tax=Candidatus Arcanibacter lacustris TaxID=1607817 RepID=A0A0F5MQN4_9RICK|nr:putative monovalent cation/H+ antiporter subunit B [Candidatus Arcanobacter lacustris]